MSKSLKETKQGSRADFHRSVIHAYERCYQSVRYIAVYWRKRENMMTLVDCCRRRHRCRTLLTTDDMAARTKRHQTKTFLPANWLNACVCCWLLSPPLSHLEYRAKIFNAAINLAIICLSRSSFSADLRAI